MSFAGKKHGIACLCRIQSVQNCGAAVGDDGDLLADLLQNGRQIGCADGAVGLALTTGPLDGETRDDEHLTGVQQGKTQFFQIGPGQVGGQATVAGVGLHYLPDTAENVAHIKTPFFSL